MPLRFLSYWHGGNKESPTPEAIEARSRANWIIDRLAATLGQEVLEHPLPESEEVPLWYIQFRGFHIDVYLELEEAGRARATGLWILVISGSCGTAVRAFRGADIPSAISHILRFSHDEKYRRLWLGRVG
jgi:hypothetical protein